MKLYFNILGVIASVCFITYLLFCVGQGSFIPAQWGERVVTMWAFLSFTLCFIFVIPMFAVWMMRIAEVDPTPAVKRKAPVFKLFKGGKSK